jgi:hypothetical protein
VEDALVRVSGLSIAPVEAARREAGGLVSNVAGSGMRIGSGARTGSMVI